MSTNTFLVLALVAVAAALVLRRLRPAWYWMSIGVTLAMVRMMVRYASVMDACGLTVPPSRLRLTLARLTNRPAPESRAAAHPAASGRPRPGCGSGCGCVPGRKPSTSRPRTDRLRHAWAIHGVTSREIKPGVVELRHDRLRRAAAGADARQGRARGLLEVPVALREDGDGLRTATTGAFRTR